MSGKSLDNVRVLLVQILYGYMRLLKLVRQIDSQRYEGKQHTANTADKEREHFISSQLGDRLLVQGRRQQRDDLEQEPEGRCRKNAAW